MNLFENKEQESEFVSDYSNPFDSDNVDEITFNIGKNLFTKEVEYISIISFKNGLTTGRHKIKSNSFIELVKQTQYFIKSL